MPIDDSVGVHAIWALALVAIVLTIIIGRVCMLLASKMRALRRSSSVVMGDNDDGNGVDDAPSLPPVRLAGIAVRQQFHDFNDDLSCAHINSDGHGCGASPPRSFTNRETRLSTAVGSNSWLIKWALSSMKTLRCTQCSASWPLSVSYASPSYWFF